MHAPWPAAVFTSNAADGVLEISSSTEQWQVAGRVLDMLVDPLKRPSPAVTVQRVTFSAFEPDLSSAGIARTAVPYSKRSFDLDCCLRSLSKKIHQKNSKKHGTPGINNPHRIPEDCDHNPSKTLIYETLRHKIPGK